MSIKPHHQQRQRPPRYARHMGCVMAVALAALIWLVPAASADTTFCSAGSGAGQCEGPQGLAIDPVSGNVYVSDNGNNRIDVFDSAGSFLFAFGWGVADGVTPETQTCTTTCFKGIVGPGSGQFSFGSSRLAIDSDPTSASYRDLYVLERGNARVQKFGTSGQFILMFGKGVNKTTGADICTAESEDLCGSGSSDGSGGISIALGGGLTVGIGGVVYVGEAPPAPGGDRSTRVRRFQASGEFIDQVVSIAAPSGEPVGLASSSSSVIYLGTSGGEDFVRKFDVGGNQVGSISTPNLYSLTLASSEHLFTSELDKGAAADEHQWVVTERDASGNTLRRFGYGVLNSSLYSLAVSPVTGELIGSEFGRVVVIPTPPPGPIACCAEATAVGNARAMLNAGADPEGKATTYHFEYVDQKSFEEGGAGFASPATKSTPEAALGSDFHLSAASAQVDVVPSTAYRFRLVATNEDGSSTSAGEFTSLPPLELGDTWSTEVGTDAARLHAEVNPLGIEASAYFQYVDDATYRADVQANGAGHGFDHAIKDPSSTIDLGSGEAIRQASVLLYPLSPGTTYHYRVIAENPFVTVPGEEHTLHTFPLPSASHEGCPNQTFRTGPSANLPDCRAFEMVSPVEKNGNDIRVSLSALNYLTGLDWSSDDGSRFSFSSSTAFAGAPSSPWTSQYMAVRDPDTGWTTHAISPQREPSSIFAAITVYLDLQYKSFSSDLSDGWLLHDTDPVLDACGAEGFLNLYRRSDATGEYEALTIAPPSNEAPAAYWPELRGVSADGTHAFFKANGKLTKDASASKGDQFYEHIAGKNGCGTLRLVSLLPNGKALVPQSASGGFGDGRSNAVNNVISEDGSRIFWSGGGPLYLRVDGKETVQISPGSNRAFFLTASPDGSRVLYTTNRRLVSGGIEIVDLYEYDVDKAETSLIDDAAQGTVAGASEDASRIYFVSRHALAASAVAGKPNLYLREVGGKTTFVATVAESDISNSFNHSPLTIGSSDPMTRGTRTTPDGSHLAFVSKASLTGYDNKDAVTGQPNVEVYLYDAEVNKLACVSCNPSGARPVGRAVSGTGEGEGRVAAELSIAENQSSFPRSLSEDGSMLFFNSYEALVPRDTNGKKDVYEWEVSTDANGCMEVGAELYVPSSGGCLSLISSGQSPQDSEFDDASPDGSDVFIKTASSLLPQDDGLIDIYDAREGGGYPPAPSAPPACEGEACQGPPAPPNDPTPASSAFEGAGNVVEKPAKKKAKKKAHKRKQAKKQSAKAKNTKKHKRANHERRAGR